MKKQTQHTPGPWKYAETPCTYHQPEIGRTYSVYGRKDFSGPIALVRMDDNNRIPFEDAESNARLIAAAPELLEALQIAQDIIRRCDNAGIPIAGDYEGRAAQQTIRAAIAKAEGKAAE